MMKNVFYFNLKAVFVFKIVNFLSWIFGNVEKKTWLERSGSFQNSWRHNLVNKHLQYAYCLMSREVNTTRWCIFVS